MWKCLNSNKISLKFVPKGPINNIPALVQIIAWHRPGDKPLSEPLMVSLTTHICVPRPQWFNPMCTQELDLNMPGNILPLTEMPLQISLYYRLQPITQLVVRLEGPLLQIDTIMDTFLLIAWCRTRTRETGEPVTLSWYSSPRTHVLTHWDRVTYICVGNLAFIVSGNVGKDGACDTLAQRYDKTGGGGALRLLQGKSHEPMRLATISSMDLKSMCKLF